MFAAGADPAPTAAMIEVVYECYPGCPILVATAHPEALRSAQVLVAEMVAAPYRVGDVLNKIGLLVSGRWGYPALPFHLGDHTARAIEYLTLRYRAAVPLSDVAGSVGLSVDRLAHVFRDEAGMTMKQYSTRLRICAGARLLAETERKLEDIALYLGFDHASHFSRVFTDVMRLRPGEYRRQVREPVGSRR
jgi:AraC-like DNA-binding protein